MRKSIVGLTLFWSVWFGAATWYICEWYAQGTAEQVSATEPVAITE